MARGDRDRGRGRGRPSGRGGDASRDVMVSKKLSWLLRHGAEKEGLKLGKGGYINLAEVLNNRNLKSLSPRPTLFEIKSIVATNEKQRFSLITASEYRALGAAQPQSQLAKELQAASISEQIDPTAFAEPQVPQEEVDEVEENYYIRANQGHSLNISSEGLLKPLDASMPTSELPSMVVHGTRKQLWSTIVNSGGLKPMGRMHVHFAKGVPDGLTTSFKLEASRDVKNGEKEVASLAEGTSGLTVDEPGIVDKDIKEEDKSRDSEKVLSGIRNSSTLLIFLDLQKAIAEGVEFFLSDNGVILSSGVKSPSASATEEGVVSTRFFSKVVERGGKVIWKDGNAV